MKLTAVVAMVGGLAMTGTTIVAADEDTDADAAAGRCGGGVFLDGLRAIDIQEDGTHDEVRIEMKKNNGDWVKIWPENGVYARMEEGQRREVDQCRGAHRELRLIEVDPANPDDHLCGSVLQGEKTLDYYFITDDSKYRLGVLR